MAHKYAEEHKKATVVLPEEFKQHAALFSDEEAKAFPPACEWDHKIELTEDAPASFNMKIYPMLKKEQEEEDKFLNENLAKGYIVPSDCRERSSRHLELQLSRKQVLVNLP